MADTIPLQHRVFNFCQEGNAILVLNFKTAKSIMADMFPWQH